MRIDVWFDISCPFSHLGRRHLELALEQFEHADEIGVVWHSFQLDRNAPAVDDVPPAERLVAASGRSAEDVTEEYTRLAQEAESVGLDFQWQRLVGGNTYDAHRLIHLARSVDLEEPVTARLLRAWFSEGAAVGDPETLVRLGAEGGLEESAVRDLLAGDDFGIDVRTDEALAAQIGVTNVPTFVLDQKYGVTGDQPAEVILRAVRQVWDLQGTEPAMAGGGCGGGCCGGGGGGGCGSGGGASESGCGGGCGGMCGDEPAHDHAASH